MYAMSSFLSFRCLVRSSSVGFMLFHASTIEHLIQVLTYLHPVSPSQSLFKPLCLSTLHNPVTHDIQSTSPMPSTQLQLSLPLPTNSSSASAPPPSAIPTSWVYPAASASHPLSPPRTKAPAPLLSSAPKSRKLTGKSATE